MPELEQENTLLLSMLIANSAGTSYYMDYLTWWLSGQRHYCMKRCSWYHADSAYSATPTVIKTIKLLVSLANLAVGELG